MTLAPVPDRHITSAEDVAGGVVLTATPYVNAQPANAIRLTPNGLALVAVIARDNRMLLLLDRANRMACTPHVGMVEQTLAQRGLRIHERLTAEGGLIRTLNSSAPGSAVAESTQATRESEGARKLVELVGQALSCNASDIHLVVRDALAEVQFRVDGELTTIRTLTKAEAELLTHAMFFKGSTKPQGLNTEEIQQWVVELKDQSWPEFGLHHQHVALRYSSRPLFPSGYTWVVRVVRMGDTLANTDFVKLGYAPAQRSLIDRMIARRAGLIVLSGKVGAGKTTALNVLARTYLAQAGGRRTLATLEDPVEVLIPHARQTSIVRRSEKATGPQRSVFADGLMALLRGDVDAILLGEIRDAETAKLIADAINLGVPLFSTVHASSALTVFMRLLQLGMDRDALLSGLVTGVIHQSLVPLLCSQCKRPLSELNRSLLPQSLLDWLDHDSESDGIFVRGQGCTACGHRGIKGRTVIAELISPDARFLRALAEGRMDLAEAWWRSGRCADNPGTVMLEHGVDLMRAGTVCPTSLSQVGDWTRVLSVDDAKARLLEAQWL